MPWLGVHVADDIKKMEWLVAAALDWRCLALTPANFLDQLLCDAWQGPFSFVQQEDAHHFARAWEFALAILSSTLTGNSLSSGIHWLSAHCCCYCHLCNASVIHWSAAVTAIFALDVTIVCCLCRTHAPVVCLLNPSSFSNPGCLSSCWAP